MARHQIPSSVKQPKAIQSAKVTKHLPEAKSTEIETKKPIIIGGTKKKSSHRAPANIVPKALSGKSKFTGLLPKPTKTITETSKKAKTTTPEGKHLDPKDMMENLVEGGQELVITLIHRRHSLR